MSFKDKLDSLKNGAQDAAEKVKDKVSQQDLHEVGDKLKGAVDNVKDKVNQDDLKEVGGKFMDAVGRVKKNVTNKLK